MLAPNGSDGDGERQRADLSFDRAGS